MSFVTPQLRMSAAGLRMAGYLLENNMRVAQVFGVAAIRANPFLASAGVKRYHGRRVDPSPDAGILPGPAIAAPKASAKPKPGAPAQITPATAVTAKPAKPEENASAPASAKETTTKPRTKSSARPEQEAGSESPRKPAAVSGDSKRATKKTGSGAASPKRSRSPSAPPALPDRTTTPEDTSGK